MLAAALQHRGLDRRLVVGRVVGDVRREAEERFQERLRVIGDERIAVVLQRRDQVGERGIAGRQRRASSPATVRKTPRYGPLGIQMA